MEFLLGLDSMKAAKLSLDPHRGCMMYQQGDTYIDCVHFDSGYNQEAQDTLARAVNSTKPRRAYLRTQRAQRIPARSTMVIQLTVDDISYFDPYDDNDIFMVDVGSYKDLWSTAAAIPIKDIRHKHRDGKGGTIVKHDKHLSLQVDNHGDCAIQIPANTLLVEGYCMHRDHVEPHNVDLIALRDYINRYQTCESNINSVVHPSTHKHKHDTYTPAKNNDINNTYTQTPNDTSTSSCEVGPTQNIPHTSRVDSTTSSIHPQSSTTAHINLTSHNTYSHGHSPPLLTSKTPTNTPVTTSNTYNTKNRENESMSCARHERNTEKHIEMRKNRENESMSCARHERNTKEHIAKHMQSPFTRTGIGTSHNTLPSFAGIHTQFTTTNIDINNNTNTDTNTHTIHTNTNNTIHNDMEVNKVPNNGKNGTAYLKINLEHAKIVLTPEQYTNVKKLIYEYRDLFCDPDYTTPPPHDIQAHIDISEDQIPHREGPRSVKTPHLKTIREYIQDGLKQGLLAPSTSDWSHALVLVSKRDGGIRVCNDFRKLNKLTKRDAYPLIKIADSLNCLHGAKFLSSVDLRNAYHNIPLDAVSRKYTAFSDPAGGLYEHTRLCFGLKNAMSIFSRFCDGIYGDLKFEYLIMYVDDIIIFSKAFDEHLSHIQEFFRRTRANGITLKASKCVFIAKSVDFCGMEVSHEGVKPPMSKLAPIINMDITSKAQLQYFINAISYYRGFITNFSKRAIPIREFLQSNRSFTQHFGKRERDAVDDLIQAFQSCDILHHPDWTKPFILETDASKHGLGAVLSQMQLNHVGKNAGKLHKVPIAFY